MILVKSYEEWKRRIIPTIGHKLNREYIRARIQILENNKHKETQNFIRVYGLEYTQRIIGYFKQALNETK